MKINPDERSGRDGSGNSVLGGWGGNGWFQGRDGKYKKLSEKFDSKQEDTEYRVSLKETSYIVIN